MLLWLFNAFTFATAFSDVIVSFFSFSFRFLSFKSLKLVLFKFVLDSLAFAFLDGDLGVANLFLLGDLLFSYNKDIIIIINNYIIKLSSTYNSNNTYLNRITVTEQSRRPSNICTLKSRWCRCRSTWCYCDYISSITCITRLRKYWFTLL